MTPEEKRTLQNHVAAAVKRLLSASGVEGAFAAARQVFEVGVWLDLVETKPAPAKTPKPAKK